MIELQKGTYRNLIYKFYKYTLWAFGGFLFYIFAVTVNLFWLFGPMPDLKELENPKSEQSSILYSEDGEELGKYFIENRSPVEFEEISPNIVNALLSTEDVRFTQHSGIDPVSIFRIVFRFGGAGGGSTLTQQLAKNLFNTRRDEDDNEISYKGLLSRIPLIRLVIAKTKEWILAVRLESRYTKQEIMKMYLNEVSYGNNAYGIRVAARTYFNKEPREVSVEQAAVLVGILQNPSLFDPRLRPENTRKRRNVVMSQMAKYGFLNQEESVKLQETAMILDYKVENQNYGLAPYFREAIKGQLRAILKELNESRSEKDQLKLYSSGLKIFTTVDSRMQTYAEQAINDHMKVEQKKFYEHWRGRNPWRDENGKEIKNFIEDEAKRTGRFQQLKEAGMEEDEIWKAMKTRVRMKVFTWAGERDTTMSPLDSIKYYKKILNCGFMAMNPTDGHVKAWVGGINFKYFKYDHVRQSKRQPGSTFKPFVYAAAIENAAFTPCDILVDQPTTFGLADGVFGKSWTPANADGRFTGASMTLRRGMGLSKNSIAAQLMKKLGPKAIASFAHECGITSDLVETPALCLGASEVSVFEQVAGYSTFVNEGHYTEPMMIMRIEDKKGNILKEFHTMNKPAITAQTAYTMTYMLQGAVQEPGGTAEGLKRYKCYAGNENGIGAKTGTTSNYSDGWFMGVTQGLVCGVWVGGDNRSIHFRNISLGQGAKMAMPAYGMFMDKCYADASIGLKKEPFIKPQNVTYDPKNCSGLPRDSTATTVPTAKPKDEDGFLGN